MNKQRLLISRHDVLRPRRWNSRQHFV